ncbi:MAG: hypothetical protein WD278_00445 [Pirellulales bacterium]
MAQRAIKWTLVVAAVLALGPLGASGHQTARGADLFYNYYAPSYAGGPPAQLYVSPRPTPPLVGHTYITYQPLMPHEFLYRHRRVYYRWDGSPIPANRTRVLWW